MLLAVAERELALFTAAQPEANVDGLLDMQKFPYAELLNHPLSYRSGSSAQDERLCLSVSVCV